MSMSEIRGLLVRESRTETGGGWCCQISHPCSIGGGEPEVVLPQSRNWRRLPKYAKINWRYAGWFASNFLNTIPVGGAAIGALKDEVSRLKGTFGGFANIGAAKIFSGGRFPI